MRRRNIFKVGILISILACSATSAFAIEPMETRSEEEKVESARADIDMNIPTALKLYQLDNGHFPTTEQGLKALLEKPVTEPIPLSWMGPYFFREPLDPWGNPYGYQLLDKADPDAPEGYKLWSNGVRGKAGESDIVKIEPPVESVPAFNPAVLDQNIAMIQKKLVPVLLKHVETAEMEILPQRKWTLTLVGDEADVGKLFTQIIALEFLASGGEQSKFLGQARVQLTVSGVFTEKARDAQAIDLAIAQLDEKLTAQGKEVADEKAAAKKRIEDMQRL